MLLYLRSQKSVSALKLAETFEVSRRTIYRDLETLSALGVPVYAERGREGGFQLLEGYFLPPLMFTTGEAVSLLLGLALLKNLRASPFEIELETARRKLLAAIPGRLNTILAEAQKLIGFEPPAGDIFHPEPVAPSPPAGETPLSESQVITIFLQAILDSRAVLMRYQSPYGRPAKQIMAQPLGMFWDRNRWYLVGARERLDPELRVWRADRVIKIRPEQETGQPPAAFDVQALLGRNWLEAAMARWRREAPVRLRLTPAQAERLRQDWYYRHADYTTLDAGQVIMTFGEDRRELVFELLRWLGPGAELLEPQAWRGRLREELKEMLALYEQE